MYPGRQKYNNRKTVVDGIAFDSQKEANRYAELKILEKTGILRDLQLQPRFEIVPAVTWLNKKFRARFYVADFSYKEAELHIVEDVKSPITRKNATYTLKRQLFLSKYGNKYLFLET